ncbi:MAG: hypothetical protein JXJ18_09245 [Rhodobacteraceae bacterium]|nr:hypothetical protein [Paracoccaceae bacterium]
MAYKHFLLAALLPLAACGGGDGTNPINNEGGTTAEPGILPGTNNPSSNRGITRYEAEDGTGSGYAREISYDSGADTFSVNNLAFDGDNTYGRSSNPQLQDLSADPATVFAVYEGNGIENDPLTGDPINQFEYRALYARSKNTTAGGAARTEFAIVRTGSYTGYGFGGFLYQRNEGVNLPSAGQATYSGNYAAIRDFAGAGGLEYAVGDMTMDIDFRDFDEGEGVKGRVYNRRILDSNGNDVTANMITALQAEYGGTYSALPELRLVVQPGVLDRNGEITGSVNSTILNGDGEQETYESGAYYALVSGRDADEVVGILTVQAADARQQGVTARETGGFILYRPNP